MPVLKRGYDKFIGGVCYQTVWGVYENAFAYVLLGGIATLLSLLTFAFWRRLATNNRNGESNDMEA